ncbi:MAG TPA: glycine cleavage system protein H [Gemmataceae bacterium]|nr:glycine cleavage system protein H [Gemmataceae bacterium]
MPGELTFMMGKFAAVLPVDFRYARNHMWCREHEGRLRFGFTSYAVRLMKDVYFLDWTVDTGTTLLLKQHIGHIETSKAQSDLFAPIAGRLVEFNKELLRDPSGINVDNYGPGWLFDMEGEIGDTMTAEEYFQFLDAGWETTQRILKGHV